MKLGKIRTILISGLLLASLLVSGTAYAQDEELTDPGITPDSPLYFIDTWGKSISMFFTFGPEAKVSKAMDYAEERLSEAQAMAAKNKFREMTRAANDYDGFMAMINERLEVMQDGASGNISENVALNTGRFHSFLDKLPQPAGH